MVAEVTRWVIAVSAVAASVGFVVLGMGMSYVEADDGLIWLGLGLMIGGVVVTFLGIIVARRTDKTDAT